jgi:transcriptional regulator with XRE-family HTH domain
LFRVTSINEYRLTDIVSTEKHQISDIFSARLEELRKLHAKTQAQIAEISGVGQSAVSAWLKGSKANGGGVVPGGVELTRLSIALGVTVDWLLGRDDTKPTAKLLRDIPAESLVDDVLAEMDNLKEQIAALDRTVRRLKTKSQISSGTNPADRKTGEISYGGGGSKKQHAPDHER